MGTHVKTNYMILGIDHESTNYKSEEEFKRFNEFKLNILHLIVDNYSSYDLNIGLLKNIIIKSSIFSISTIPWSNKSCKEISEKIIQKCLDLNSNLINDDFYINILNNDLKSKIIKIGKSSKITSQGRKKIDNIFNNTKLGYKDDSIYSSDSKDSWKFQCPEVLSSLYWIINKLSSKDINNNWFILIPSILNIIDDYECIIKAYGCLILNQLLSKIDPLFLKRTGLGPIFWESLTNCTAYLPTLTPVSDSIFILNNSLTTLNSLVPILETDKSKQMYLYGETLQNCILRGISHSGENIKIMKTLLNHVQISIHNLQIYSVKYLSQLIEICRSIITDPYNMVDCSLTIQSLKLLNITICNCWPRIKYYQYDIIYTTATAWKQLEREKKSNNNNNYHKDLNIIEKEIKNIINLLKDCCENEEVEETIKIVKGNDRYENFCSGF